ncbi:MAG: hypothetical protein RMZ69_34365 [Nostoc sp. ChiQUE01a]|nr:hypothetical protein [Nostoc sp. ChiQUE01a]
MENTQVLIDLSKLDPQLPPDRLEDLTGGVADEIREELVNKIELVREDKIPGEAKPGAGGFILGLLQAEVNAENIKALLNYLRERFSSKTLKLEWEDKENGTKVVLEYQNVRQLEQQLQAIERLSKLKISVVNQ